MKKFNLSSVVMDRVAHFEDTRIRWWQRMFATIVSFVIAGIFIFVWLTYREFVSAQMGSLFVLFGEDWEIINDYWQDTMSTILIELPVGYIVIAALLVSGIGIFLYSTRRSRKIITTKKHELSALKQKGLYG